MTFFFFFFFFPYRGYLSPLLTRQEKRPGGVNRYIVNGKLTGGSLLCV